MRLERHAHPRGHWSSIAPGADDLEGVVAFYSAAGPSRSQPRERRRPDERTIVHRAMADDEKHPSEDDRRSGNDRRSGDDRRKKRSSFVQRIGRAKNRRSGDDRRTGNDRRSDG